MKKKLSQISNYLTQPLYANRQVVVQKRQSRNQKSRRGTTQSVAAKESGQVVSDPASLG